MKQIVGIATLAALLAGCDPTPEEQRNFQSQLPPGCSAKYLGPYGSVEHVVVVNCDGRATSSSSYERRSGKTHSNYAVVTIQR